VLDRLKKPFSPRKGPEVEYDHREGSDTVVVPAGPPTAPQPPAVPVEKPVPEERDRQP
jgi:hypothetical protein